MASKNVVELTNANFQSIIASGNPFIGYFGPPGAGPANR